MPRNTPYNPNGKLRLRESIMDKVREYDKHIKLEGHTPGGIHPEGCFFCGGHHQSIMCDKQDEWHRNLEEGRPVTVSNNRDK